LRSLRGRLALKTSPGCIAPDFPSAFSTAFHSSETPGCWLRLILGASTITADEMNTANSSGVCHRPGPREPYGWGSSFGWLRNGGRKLAACATSRPGQRFVDLIASSFPGLCHKHSTSTQSGDLDYLTPPTVFLAAKRL